MSHSLLLYETRTEPFAYGQARPPGGLGSPPPPPSESGPIRPLQAEPNWESESGVLNDRFP